MFESNFGSNEKAARSDMSEKNSEAPEARAERLHARCFGIVLLVIGIGSLAVAWSVKDAVPVVGATLLGFIVGMLVGFFAQETEEWSRSAMTASVAVLAGAGTLALLHYGAAFDPQGIWFYPIGLVVGFGFGTVWVAADPAFSAHDQTTRKSS